MSGGDWVCFGGFDLSGDHAPVDPSLGDAVDSGNDPATPADTERLTDLKLLREAGPNSQRANKSLNLQHHVVGEILLALQAASPHRLPSPGTVTASRPAHHRDGCGNRL